MLGLSTNKPSDLNRVHAVVFRKLSNKTLPSNTTIYYNNRINAFIHSVLYLTTSPTPHPKSVLHPQRRSMSSLNFQYPFFSLRLSSSRGCLRFLPRLLVTSVLLSVFPSVTSFRRQFLRKMWPIQLAFLLCIAVCTIFLFLSLCDSSSLLNKIGSTDHLHPSPAPHFKTYQINIY